MTEEKYVLAIDEGTTSARAIIFNHSGQIVSVGQKEFEQIFPRAGWVEHDAVEIWESVREVIGQALSKASINRHQLSAVGITNQRETAVVWDKNTGEPVYNAIVWQDTRTQKICDELAGDEGPDRFKDICGLPLATYFSGPKVKWILDNVEGARAKAEAGDLLFGNMDTWVLWNLTGGVNGGVHVTEPTNASRTMLMDVRKLQWDDSMCEVMGIPKSMLPGSSPPPRCTARPPASPCSSTPRSPASWATSRQPPSDRPASRRATPRTPMAPVASCS